MDDDLDLGALIFPAVLIGAGLSLLAYVVVWGALG